MPNKVREFMRTLSDEWQGLLTLGGAVSFGAVIGGFGIGLLTLPKNVSGNTQTNLRQDSVLVQLGNKDLELERRDAEFDRRFSNLVCLLEAERTKTSTLNCDKP